MRLVRHLDSREHPLPPPFISNQDLPSLEIILNPTDRFVERDKPWRRVARQAICEIEGVYRAAAQQVQHPHGQYRKRPLHPPILSDRSREGKGSIVVAQQS